MEKYDLFLGKSLTEVQECAKTSGLITRIVNKDNVPFMVTCDYRIDRLNLTVDNGIVTEISVG